MESTHALRFPRSACFQLLSILPVWFLFLARVATVTVNREEEVRALLNFRDLLGTIDSGHTEAYWTTWNNSDHNPCTWIGVTCTANYTVEELDFSGWGLSIIYLEELTALRDLRRLDLSSHNYVEDLVSIGKLDQLIRLDLSWCDLGGPLPPGFFANKNLRFLNLEQAQFGSQFGRPLTSSNFSESISSNISDLVNLQFLNLAGNLFTGPFPTAELGGLNSLLSLDLSGNSFSGRIPSLPKLTSLIELKLDDNNFTGFEESWFLGRNLLKHLSVSNNKLEGKIPASIANSGDLSFLNLSSNNLSDHIPSGFSTAINNTGLSLDLSYNQLTGGIPPDMLQSYNIDQCPSINLSHNVLTGSLSAGSKSVCFVDLILSNNELSGPIPWNFFYHNENETGTIQNFWVSNNNLSGDIVDFLSNDWGLVEARLENNSFTGDLSKINDLSGNQRTNMFLQVLDLSNNVHLQWSVSEANPDPIQATLNVFSSFGELKEFQIGGNNFSGTSLPTSCFFSIYARDSFTVLDLSNSQLEGEIVGAAFNSTCIPSIQILNLSNNHATGSLQKSLVADRPLSPNFVLDVSNNNLSGPLPVISQSSDLYNSKYFAGNAGLCGSPLPPCPVPPTTTPPVPPSTTPPQSQSQLQVTGIHVQWWVIFIAISGSVLIAAGSCLAVTWRWRLYRKKHQQDADLIKTLLERESATLMTLRELKKATENFAESAQIGEGGFGTVYVGKLDNGTMVAVKRSKREGSEKDKQQFLNEVRILSQIKHRHLVKLLGCCMENKTAVLVFEFISNGTLQEHLQRKCGAAPLSWKQRLNIATQTADALNYLHSTTIFPIYHRDVKSANILLDDELNAKVADFGISKLAPVQATHVSTVAVQGTIGYIDPEYYTSYQLTDKSDVYSFGVVLLELISARPALDFHRVGDETSLVYFSGPYIARGDLARLIDPALMETYTDPVGQARDSILSVGKLAMKCLEMRSKTRPSMYEVLKELKQLWVDIGGTSNIHPTDENDNDDLEQEHGGLHFDIQSEENFSLGIEFDASGIQLSHSPGPHSLRLRSLER